MYPQTSDVSHTLVGNDIVGHSDVVGLSLVSAAPTTSSFSTQHTASNITQRQLQDKRKNISVLGFGATNMRGLMVTPKNEEREIKFIGLF